MIRIKMPLNFRMQNFRFKNNRGIFWTSASKTIAQKIKRWMAKDKSELCNASDGYTLPSHGQFISDHEVNGRFEYKTPGYYGYFRGKGYLQGVFDDFAVYGASGAELIEVKFIDGEDVYLEYSSFEKWWWKHWEAEGCAKDRSGNLWVGISVKSRFGFIINYRYQLTNKEA